MSESLGALLGDITDAFTCEDGCARCRGEGIVCEAHPDVAWGDGEACCGAAGMPCRPERR